MFGLGDGQKRLQKLPLSFVSVETGKRYSFDGQERGYYDVMSGPPPARLRQVSAFSLSRPHDSLGATSKMHMQGYSEANLRHQLTTEQQAPSNPENFKPVAPPVLAFHSRVVPKHQRQRPSLRPTTLSTTFDDTFFTKTNETGPYLSLPWTPRISPPHQPLAGPSRFHLETFTRS
ncbi:unnamed protein product [Sympodiomycopsis kandeliae]